jgi:hypothetical protein
MKTMYCTFIRPILEYGSVQFMGAAQTHLEKLDSVQRTAAKIGRFEVESLQCRREAAAVSLTFKLLDGAGRGVLKGFVPEIVDIPVSQKRCRQSSVGLQIVSRCKINSLNSFKRSYLGSIHNIWAKLPQDKLRDGENKGWRKVTKACKNFLMGKTVVTCKAIKDPLKKSRKVESTTNVVGEMISDVFMIANGYYCENGMWFAHDNTEN